MQAETDAKAMEILHNVLRKVSSEKHPDRAVYIALQELRDAIGADGASITHRQETKTHLSSGQLSAWIDDVEALAGWQVPHVLKQNSPLPPNIKVEARYWYTRLFDDDVLLSIWFRQAPAHQDELFLAALVDVVEMTLKTQRAHHQQERANLLADSIIKSIVDPLIVLRENRTVVALNPAAETLFSMNTVAAYGLPLSAVVKDEKLMTLIDSPQESDDRRPAEWTTGEDGQFTYLPLLSVVRTPDDVPDGWVLALRDVSRFKRLNRNQREFMRIVSHDLRSPLTYMQGFADMVRSGMAGDVNEKQVYFIDKILAGISQMTSIVENIQDAGRFDPETGFYDMQRNFVDVGEIVDRVVSNLIIPAEKHAVKVEVNISDDLPVLYADENMLSRAVINLVDNAIKYTRDDGQVTVSVFKRQVDVVISVKDNGYGISEENQKRLFQRHMRIARKEHAKVKGTGLGLFIVKAVAQAHGGDVLVESILEMGTTFSIVIPLNASAEGAAH